MNPRWEDDPDALPTEEELAAAARLQEALDGDGDAEGDAAFAEALRAAHAPEDLPAERHELILQTALTAARPRRSNVIRVVFGGGALALAAAAAAVLVLGPMQRKNDATPASATAAMVPCRSTQDLFEEPFPREGQASSRVDRIASARSRDLRANRFAAWGVR